MLSRPNVVVVGPSRGIAAPLRGSRVIVHEVRGLAVPQDTTSTTRAVVIVVDDVTHALERAALVRAWAQPSALPLIFVSEFEHQARSVALWQGGLCSLSLERNEDRLRRLLMSLDAGRVGLPDERDVEMGFRLRMRLRHPEVERLGVGIEVFVANRTVFVAGLLRPGVSPARLTTLLAPLGKSSLNTDALLCGLTKRPLTRQASHRQAPVGEERPAWVGGNFRRDCFRRCD